MLHPDLQTADAIASLQSRWRACASLRLEPFLAPDTASGLLTTLRRQPFTLMATVSPNLSFQYYSFALRPDDVCDHVLCDFGRWMWTDFARWMSSWTGLELAPPTDRLLQSSLYTKGCYLDPHNDWDGQRQVAFIIGLTPSPPEPRNGGHLEFLTTGAEGVQLAERRAPGWNTLDVFDVREPVRLHRIPLVTEPVERRAISGWLYPAAGDARFGS